MSITRELASLFAALSVALALLIGAGGGSGAAALAQNTDTSTCGGYQTNECKQVKSCAGLWWAKTCTTYTYYWPPAKDDDEKDEPTK